MYSDIGIMFPRVRESFKDATGFVGVMVGLGIVAIPTGLFASALKKVRD